MLMDLERVRFGSFEFDPSSGELWRDGMPLRLEAQPAKVLSHLIRQSGQIVSREDLHNAIWSDDTFVDFERGLNVCVAQIRSALNDESTSPLFIRTVARRGYQFIHSVEPIVPASSDITPPIKRREFPWRTLVLSVISLIVVCAVLIVINESRRTAPDGPMLPGVAVMPFENHTGDSGLNSFCSALTQNVAEQLTSAAPHYYRVLGDAQNLHTAGDGRDLAQMAASVNAQFVIVGQVQGDGSEMRVLAQLIHMPEQTHVWVVRLEQPVDDPFALESSAAHDIATEFSRKLQDPAVLSNLRPPATH